MFITTTIMQSCRAQENPITLGDFLPQDGFPPPQTKRTRRKGKRNKTTTITSDNAPASIEKKQSLFEGVERVVNSCRRRPTSSLLSSSPSPSILSQITTNDYELFTLTIPSDDCNQLVKNFGTIEEKRQYLLSSIRLCEINARRQGDNLGCLDEFRERFLILELKDVLRKCMNRQQQQK